MDEYFITFNKAGVLKYSPNGLCNIHKKGPKDNYYETLPYEMIISKLLKNFKDIL